MTTPPPLYKKCQPSQVEARDSNIELLRLVCMAFVLMLHLLRYAIFPKMLSTEYLDFGTCAANLIYSFCIVAVDCFVLITGFFGLQFKLRHITNFYLICAFYGLLSYLFHLGVDEAHIGKGLLFNTFLPFSHSSLWFINCYVILFFISPLLNKAIDNMNKKEHVVIIGAMTFIQVYLGNFWQTPLFDLDGLHILNFIYLYVIGRYIAKHIDYEKIVSNRYVWLLIYMLCALLVWGGNILNHYVSLSFWRGYSYNSILVLVEAISLFLFVKSLMFRNKIINWAAISSVAIYLGHENCYVRNHLYSFVTSLADKICQSSSPTSAILLRILLAIGLCFCIMTFFILLDKLRIVIMQPIWKVYDKYVTKSISQKLGFVD